MKPFAFGRYYLTDLVARGGMAEVFRARSYGSDGFEKQCAVKRILQQFSEDRRFLSMLGDEARLAVQLTHSNIVQIYDFGQAEGQYFISMEYVEGVDLNTLIELARAGKGTVPEEIACHVVAEMCAGLDYAHRKSDPAGKPLGLVHRDISPHNVLVSYEGEVKVVDFGIAKAATNVSHTQTGTLKGKFGYMSPEQARGEAIDQRTDIFATGCVLYELLSLKRLFDGDSAMEILGKITGTQVHEGMLPESMPAALRKICGRALQNNSNDRYQHASEFERDLRRYLLQSHPDFSRERLAEYVKKVCADKISERDRTGAILIDPKLKAQLANYSGGQILATAALKEEALDQTVAIRAEKATIGSAVLGSARRIVWPLAIASTILFFLSDFLKPAIKLSPLLLLLSAGVAASVYFTSIRKYLASNPVSRVLQSSIGQIMVFACASVAIWGLATVVSFFTPPRGLLAANIEPVGSLQENLFHIRTELATIRATTEEIATGVKDVKKAIEELGKTAGIIAKPKTPQEFYHNARYYALEGKGKEALDSYGAFISAEPNFFDAHEAYLSLLKSTGGEENARTTYNELARKFPDNPVILLMQTRLLPASEQRIAVHDFVIKFPNFAPGHYETVRRWVDQGLYRITRNELARAKASYDYLKGRQEEFRAHFADMAELQKAMDTVNSFERYLERFTVTLAEGGMKIDTEQYSNYISVTILPQEPTYQRIYYSINDPNNLKDIGLSTIIDTTTGKPSPEHQVQLKLDVGKYKVYAKYTDSNGEDSPVQEAILEVKPFIVGFNGLPFGPNDSTRDVDVHVSIFGDRKFRTFLYSLDSPALDRKKEYSGGIDEHILLKDIAPGKHAFYLKGIAADSSSTETCHFDFEIP